MKSVALSAADTLTRELLPDHFCHSSERISPQTRSETRPRELWSLEEMERFHIARVLESTGWHKGRACEILGVSRPRPRRIIRLYGLASPTESGDDETD